MHLIAHENISQWLVSAILRLVMLLRAICFLINSCCFANPLVHVMGHSPAHLTNLYAFFADLLRLSWDLFILSQAVTVSALASMVSTEAVCWWEFYFSWFTVCPFCVFHMVWPQCWLYAIVGLACSVAMPFLVIFCFGGRSQRVR